MTAVITTITQGNQKCGEIFGPIKANTIPGAIRCKLQLNAIDSKFGLINIIFLTQILVCVTWLRGKTLASYTSGLGSIPATITHISNL